MAGVTDALLAASEQRLVGEGVARRACKSDLLQGPRCLPVEDPAHLPRPTAGQRGEISSGKRAAARRSQQAEHVQGQVIAGPAQQLGDLLVSQLAQPGGMRAVRQHIQLVRRENCQRVSRIDILGQPGEQAAGDQYPSRQARQPTGQPPGDAVPARPQVLIQPVHDQQQLPVPVRGALRGLLPQLPEHVHIRRGRRVLVEQPGQLRHDSGQEPLPVSITGRPGQEVGHAVDLGRQRVHRLGQQCRLACPRPAGQPRVLASRRSQRAGPPDGERPDRR